ncbi:hypothetical protein DRJ22_03835 [Candidatus Woesearchaeota archaeon]|nr:MAG: hypothetical protein B6U93_01005 [Candidatus Woesearchaeota archaeon ex4484_78]RLE45688.1 MAG: hypothetical protein DRJ22_03835 [Candidatus Woesearchaeota archaeon]
MRTKTIEVQPFKPNNLKSFFKKKKEFEIKNLKEFLFDEAVQSFDGLKKTNIKLKIKKPVLFYPGSAWDALLPVIVLKTLFEYFYEATIIFADTTLPVNTVLGYFKQLTGTDKIYTKGNMARIVYENCIINCLFLEEDVVARFPEIEKYDVYLERGFQMFREKNPLFLEKSIELLKKGGLFITDYGNLKRKDLKELEIPKSAIQLGLYKGFKVYEKVNR